LLFRVAGPEGDEESWAGVEKTLHLIHRSDDRHSGWKNLACLSRLTASANRRFQFQKLSQLFMPFEPPDRQYWEAAVGYVELGMFLDADAELERIDPFNRAAPEVLAIRIAIYQGLKEWGAMREIAKRLAEFQPEEVQWVVSYAYASRRAESIAAAKEILLNAEAKFPKETIIKYNLACYCCQMGDVENAKNYLKKAFEIDSSWRSLALEDEDLKPLWDSLQAT
jgi:tetratricopeptide (TPR) repeat protein